MAHDHNNEGKSQELQAELSRIQRSRDKWIAFYQGLEKDFQELKNYHNLNLDRLRALEQSNEDLTKELERCKTRLREKEDNLAALIRHVRSENGQMNA